MPDHLMIVDGSNLMHRAIHTTAGGQPARLPNAMRFLLSGLIRRWEASHLLIALDSPEPCFRHALIPGYKGDRSGRDGPGTRDMTDLLRPAFLAWRVATREAPAMEADDVIASLVQMARGRGFPVSIVTRDSDLLQLVDDGARTRVLWPQGRGDGELVMDEEAVGDYLAAHKDFCAAFPPARLHDLRVLAGGKDSLPRVGWTEEEREGKKAPWGFTTRRAAALLATGATLASLIAGEHDSLLKPREREWLTKGSADALARYEIMRLRTDLAPIGNGASSMVDAVRFGVALPDLVPARPAEAAPAAPPAPDMEPCADCGDPIPVNPAYKPNRCTGCAFLYGRRYREEVHARNRAAAELQHAML